MKLLKTLKSTQKVTQGYSRLLKVTQGYSRLLKVTQGYSRLLKVTQGLLLILIFFAFNVSCSDDAKGPAVPIEPSGKNPDPTDPSGKNPGETNPNMPTIPDPTDTVPPAGVSGATFGDLNVIVWANPTDADFSGVLILRNTVSITDDAPSVGKEYTVGGDIGSSEVVQSANSSDFGVSAATMGTAYYYKIFAYDASHNYAAGVEIEATRSSDKTIFVNVAASGANDGTSWSNAYSDLRSVLKLPVEGVVATTGDKIVVAKGVYKPATSDRTKSFRLVSNVKVYGGFVGTEHSLSQRNWRMNKSILSGDLDSNDIDSSGGVDADGIIENAGYIKGTETMDANGDAVVTNKNTKNVVKGATSATLDGFTITAGQTSAAGGGFFNEFDNLKLSNIIFSGNWAGLSGGGLYSSGAKNLTLSNVVFSGNVSAGAGAGTGGGGCYFTNSNNHLILSNVVFSGNTGNRGGGMRINNSTNVILSNVVFSGNVSTGVGGAANIRNGSDIFLINVIMWGNTGVACTGTGTDFKGNMTFCTVSAEPTISHSLIQGCGVSGLTTWAMDTSSCGTDGGNNKDGDPTDTADYANYPMFVNAGNAVGGDGVFGTADDGLRLMMNSPAIDAGSNNNPVYDVGSSTPPTNMEFLFGTGALGTGALGTGALDLAGKARIVGSSIDMGAYEFQAE